MRKHAIICLALLLGAFSAGAQRYDNAAEPIIFKPQGTWMVSGNARYTSHSQTGGSILIVNGIESQGYSFIASPAVSWFVRDNIAVGVRGGYSRSLMDLDSAGMDFSDISIDVSEYYYIRHKGEVAVFFRPYIPIGPSRRVAMFAEVDLGGSRNQSKAIDGHTGFLEGSWQQGGSLFVKVHAGVTSFITDRLAIEASVGMFNLGRNFDSQVHNQVGEGRVDTWTANFILDVTALNVGAAIYF